MKRTVGDELGPEARSKLDQILLLAENRLDAADLLARCPHRAESIRVLVRALQALDETLGELKTAANGSLSAIVPEDTSQTLRAFRERLEAAPAADAQLSPEQLRTLADARKFSARLRARLRGALRTRRALLVRRALVGSLALGIAVLLGLALTHLKDGITATASSRYSAEFAPEDAIDSNPQTEWLAQDGKNAWLELALIPAIDVTAVRVLNARNEPYNDRATKGLRVELYRENSLVADAAAEFDPKSQSQATSLVVQVAGEGVTRIRFVALSHYGKGAGLAEVEVIGPSRATKRN